MAKTAFDINPVLLHTLLMELVSRIAGHVLLTTDQTADEGEEIPTDMAHHSGLERIEAH